MFLGSAIISLLFGGALFASDLAGNWKLDVAKSNQHQFATATAQMKQTGPDTYHVVYDGARKSGEKTHQEASTTYDGKKHESSAGASVVDEHPDASTWTFTRYKDGKIVNQMRTVVSKGNTTATTTTKDLGADGKAVQEVFVWERQP